MSHDWRNHPALRDRFHPEHPDDVQVIVHDGGPRLTDRRPEAVWLRVLAHADDVFTGEVLNPPGQLRSVKRGDRVQFVVPDSGGHPLMVRPPYLAERGQWHVHPCNKCGLSELMDAPSELIAKIFPNLPPDQTPVMFTSFCGLCGGVQGVESADADGGASEPTDQPASTPYAGPMARGKRWWQFWK
jgi:hypothetical protein